MALTLHLSFWGSPHTLRTAAYAPAGPGQEQDRHRPGSILGTAVDIGAIFKEVSYNVEPTPCTSLVQGTVTRVVAVVHITNLVLQAVQDHFLQGEERRYHQTTIQ